eukprot:CAMPEP_0196813048 /NCGR_PEP_ID=MMETSP1362-20130617/33259_1 /TAXON_ID=163516 /ORGANISM="Leptocylindrus danicus, Strain CCMP1856" /LENGTH=157 /DNA_ID=CAMNT_0042189061 /DNA_START=110 /DNA_END=583 /DNA_ORIENTATION=+
MREKTYIRDMSDEDDRHAEDDEDDFEPLMNRSAEQWGLRDAPYKMILCVNKELKMGNGKIAAQCCHAAVGCYKSAMKHCPRGLNAWELTGCAKVAVKVPLESELDEIMEQARDRGIPYYLVCDAGRTQIAAGSRTVLGLGPAPVAMFEGVTDHLKLM